MQCTLLIPHLLWPPAASTEAGTGSATPALEAMLARGRRECFPAICLEGWLCQAFETERQNDWPVAPLTLTVDGGNPAGDYWLRADPVHLRARREQLLLAGPDLLHVTTAESQQLTSTLNAHFGPDTVSFQALHPARWYTRLAETPDLTTKTLTEAAGANVANLMPSGSDALRWHRTVNEIQMLLHDHPVNLARESRGELAINSVWIWGGGIMPPVPGRHFTHIFATNPLAAALATCAGLDAFPVPPTATSWRQSNHVRHKTDAHHLIVLEHLASAAQYGDVASWWTQIALLEKDWFSPLLATLGKNGFDRLSIVSIDESAAVRFECGARVRWAVWRRPVALAAHLRRAGRS